MMLALISSSMFWWAIFIGVLVLGWIAEECLSYFISFFLLITLIVLIQYKLHLFTLNPLLTAYITLAYLVTGTLWSFVKWFLVVLKSRENFDAGLQYELPRTRLSGESDDEYRHRRLLSSMPQASQHKSDLALWIAYWPLNLISTLCSDIIKRIFIKIADQFIKVYDYITNRVYADLLR